MKRLLLALLCLTALMVSAAKKKQVNPIRVTHLRTERLVQPMSVDTPTPRLGWVIETDKGLKDVMQTSYRLIVASTREKAEALIHEAQALINEANKAEREIMEIVEGKI